MAETDLYQRNILYLMARAPALAGVLEHQRDSLSRLIRGQDGVASDIDLGGGMLYRMPAPEFVRQQLDRYFERPVRHLVNPPDAGQLADDCSAAMARHLAAATGDGASLASAPPVDRTGFLVVIGLGLGLHVAELIQRTNPRHVLLVEPLHEFLRHSLEATDWQDVLEDCRAHRRTVDFVVEAELTEIVERLHELIEAYGPCQLDGSHVYLHYRTPVTELVRRQFEELAGTKMILKGYYRDEVRMVQNTIDNVQGADFSLIAGGLRPPRSEPAIIVGSGPSIDTAVGAIERWSGHAVIFSAGSSLQVLLEHGIVPDFHVENENSQISVERLQFIVDRFADRFPRGRFDGIRLVASTTVQPAVLGLFPERSLFFRNGLSAADMFGRGSRPLDGTGPFSANAALTLAAVLGFRDVYLFGCDCGAKTAADHHSRHTVYYTRGETMARAPVDLPLAAAGNFGGQVLVNSYFVDSRQMFEAVIAAVDLEVHNCSDGALIDGAMPMDPSDMAIATAPLDKAAVVADIRAAGKHFAPGVFLGRVRRAPLGAEWRRFFADFRGVIDAGDRTIEAFDRRIRGFLSLAAADYGGVARMVAGSALAMSYVGAYYLNRTTDEAARAVLFAEFRAEYQRRLDAVCADGGVLFDRVEAQLPPPAHAAG